MSNIYESKRMVYVTPVVGSPLRYGFPTNIDLSRGEQLGHTLVQGALPEGYIVGANLPKPARASRRFADGTTSSFIDAGSVVQARNLGWSVTKAKIGTGNSSARSTTVFIRMGLVKYAWRMRNTTFTRIQPDFAGLGIVQATPADKDLVFGARTPRPPRATKVVLTGDEVDTLGTFYDPDNDLPAGWSGSGSLQDPLEAID